MPCAPQSLVTGNSRVRLFHATVEEAAATWPFASSFDHGFYSNPEVAVLLFTRTHPHYQYYWIIEADVRWTVRGLGLRWRYS